MINKLTEKKQEKYAKENRAICGACERYIERWDEGNNNGVIYDHGFTKSGGRSNSCVGSRHQPWEKSIDGKVVYIKKLKKQKNDLLNQKPNEKIFSKLSKQSEEYEVYDKKLGDLRNKYYQEFYTYDRGLSYMERQTSEFETWLSDNKGIKITRIEFPKFLNTLVYKQTTLNNLLEVWNQNMKELFNQLNKEQDKVVSWEEKLTPKEKFEDSKLNKNFPEAYEKLGLPQYVKKVGTI